MQKREEKTEGELRNKGGEKVDRHIGGRHQDGMYQHQNEEVLAGVRI